MKTPKNTKELLVIVAEQEKQIIIMKKAMTVLENRIKHVSMVSERLVHNNQRLQSNVNLLESQVKLLRSA